MSKRFVKPRVDAPPTRFLYLSGVGSQMGTNAADLRALFGRYGELEGEGVEMIPDKRFCYVIFLDALSAIDARNALNGVPLPELQGAQMYIKFADEYAPPQPMPEPECTSMYPDVEVPGLTLIPDFITEEDHERLMNGICSPEAPWEQSLNRKVQHFGFCFNYRTLMLDYTKHIPPIPADVSDIAERISQMSDDYNMSLGLKKKDIGPINQLTFNEYFAGQGIAPHIDTEACFGPIVFILSTGSGVTMTLTKRDPSQTSGSAKHQSQGQTDGSDTDPLDTSTSDAGGEGRIKKHIWLPPRSLLIMKEDARAVWSHGIASRTSDKVDGVIRERGRRVSLTFRQALLPGEIPSSRLTSSEIEKDHVFRVYDNIAVHWNHTRGRRKVHWHRVKAFLESLPPGTLMADIGSGDGKYFGVNENITTIGCDRSLKLLQVQTIMHKRSHLSKSMCIHLSQMFQ
jgi:alkylated DNA repair protein alkB family protein 8